MSEVTKASAAEWEVLRVIWSLDEATSRSVSEVLKETQNWEVATTKTLLGRLVKKGYLKTTKEGNHFVYTATLSEKESVNRRVNRLFDSICQAGIGKAIASVIEDYDLSVSDKQLILEALNNKAFKAKLNCDCLTKDDGTCNCDHEDCECKRL